MEKADRWDELKAETKLKNSDIQLLLIQKQEEEIKHLKNSKFNLERRVASQRTEIKDLRLNIKRARNATNAKERKIKILKTENEELKVKLDIARGEYEQME